VSVYTQNLVQSLLKIDRKNEYLLYGGSLRRKSDLDRFVSTLKGNFTHKFLTFPPTLADIAWNKLHIINLEKVIGRFDVAHTSDWAEPPSHNPKVTTIHDLAPINFPGETHPRIVAAHKNRLKLIKKESSHIIAPSMHTKRELQRLGFENITAIPEAANPKIKKVATRKVTRVKSKFGIVGDYVVGWGTSKRKNYDRSIEAFNKEKQKLGLTSFVLLGNTSYNKDDVIKTGFVSNEEVSALYSGAQALLFPSLDEGFGISILDAFVCGCPVVTSSRSSMPEVAGNAAILVDPYSTDAIAVGLSRAIKNANLLNKKAKVQLKKFSWEDTARQTLKIYEKAAKP
jgi:glycosyltransferase involved in cell wall biosynthesis